MRWKPEKWWAGLDAVLIGGGPSLSTFEWDRLIPYKTIGCNDAYSLGSDICDVAVFGDQGWFNHHRRGLQEFGNPVFTNQPYLHTDGPAWLYTMAREGDGLHCDALGWGGNTGCIGVNLALLLGVKRVFLLGMDMKLGTQKQTNWHQENVTKPNDASYKRFTMGFQRIADVLPDVFPGCEVINLGPDSELKMFPFADLDSVIELLEVKETRNVA